MSNPFLDIAKKNPNSIMEVKEKKLYKINGSSIIQDNFYLLTFYIAYKTV